MVDETPLKSSKPVGRGCKFAWTPEEDAILSQQYARKIPPEKMLGVLPARNVRSIKKRLKSLGMSVHPSTLRDINNTLHAPDKDDLLAQLRAITNPVGKKASCLCELSDEHLLEVFALLKAPSKTWTYLAITRHIQQKLGVLSGYAEQWINQALARLAEKMLGRRRGLARTNVPTQELRIINDRARKREEYAREKYQEIQRLGANLNEWEEEIKFWIEEGRTRGTPYDKYVTDLAKIIVEGSKVRHAMRDTEGHFKKRPTQIDMNIRQIGLSVERSIDDPNEFGDFMNLFKNRLEGIAEVGQLPEPPPSNIIDMDENEYSDETELQPEDCELDGCCEVDAPAHEGTFSFPEE